MNRRTFWHLLFALMMTLVWGCDLPFFGDDSSDEESALAAPVDYGYPDPGIPMEGGGEELEEGDPVLATEDSGEEQVDEAGAETDEAGPQEGDEVGAEGGENPVEAEDCESEGDDDGDGLVNCEDPECWESESCSNYYEGGGAEEVEGPPGPCTGFCGGYSDAGCRCDPVCILLAECCEGICDSCGDLHFCKGSDAVEEGDKTVWETLSETEGVLFAEILAQLPNSEVPQSLNSPDTFWTVFAPSQEALIVNPQIQLAILSESFSSVASTVFYHIVPGMWLVEDLPGASPLVSLTESNLSVDLVSGLYYVNNMAAITTENILCSNGVIHIINYVLEEPQ